MPYMPKYAAWFLGHHGVVLMQSESYVTYLSVQIVYIPDKEHKTVCKGDR